MAQASSVMQTNLDQQVQESALIFEGRVVSSVSRLSAQSGQPFTYFTFEVLDVIKGRYTDNTIELGFLGGLKNGRILRVTDMRFPDVGEEGIYFVESLQLQQVHPFFGWHQGHYKLVPQADGAARVVPSASLAGAANSRINAALVAPTVDAFKRDLQARIGQSQ